MKLNIFTNLKVQHTSPKVRKVRHSNTILVQILATGPRKTPKIMLKTPEKWPKFGKCDPKNPKIEKKFSLDTLVEDS